MRRTDSFSRFLLLWAGELISAVGGGLTSFGLGVYVFQSTGSAASMALVTLIGFLPTLLLSVPAGVLADRYDRRVLMMLGDGLSALGIAYILLCIMHGDVQLWQICLGVAVSSTFSALLEPAYRATVTDLLTPEEYSRANGLVSLAGSARYLISPVLAGGLLAGGNIETLLIIDICTFFPTVLAAAAVRRTIGNRAPAAPSGFSRSVHEGWAAISQKPGVLLLVLLCALITCFMGAFQTLAQPMILGLADTTALGIGETVCACGMLVSSLILGAKGVERNYAKVLCLSLLLAGAGMVGFALWKDLYVICLFGFIFFAALPFANNCLDFLVRTNIPDSLQGRAWGMIGFVSQAGYVVAYAASGAAADAIAARLHVSVGQGAAAVIIISGALLTLTAAALYPIRCIRALEHETPHAASDRGGS